jgi:hypothetical protein
MRRLLLALSAVSLLACGDSSGPGASSAVGTWNLVSVNGDSNLPVTIFYIAPSYRLEIVSATFVAASNGTYTGSATTRETDNGQVTTTTDSDSGTWSQTGNTVTVTASDGTVGTGTISGNNITLDDEGLVTVYHRQ